MLRRDFVDLVTKVAGARILASARSRAARVLDAAPPLGERAAPFAAPYLDAHAHSMSGLLLAYHAVTGVARGDDSVIDGPALIRRMDADGIRRAFVLSTAYQMAPDAYATRTSESTEPARVRIENDFTADECARYPDRLVPFLSVNPKRGYAVEEVDRCVEQKMRGVKLHLWNSLLDTRQAADLAALRRVVERAAHHRLAVVAHILVGAVPDYGPDDTERFVREIIMPFDTLQISIAHLAGAGEFGIQHKHVSNGSLRSAAQGHRTRHESGRTWRRFSPRQRGLTTRAGLANCCRGGAYIACCGEATTATARSSSRAPNGHSMRLHGVQSPSSAAPR